jgi:hypothetical protein
MGKKFFLLRVKGERGAQEGWNAFLKCVLMNYPTIRMGEKKFSSSSSS